MKAEYNMSIIQVFCFLKIYELSKNDKLGFDPTKF